MRSEIARKALWGLAAAALALLGLWLALQRIQPGLVGWINDDGMYAIYAKALLEGRGYVETSMGEPIAARRYPIGLPALLALAAWGSESLTEMIVRMQIVGPLSVALFVLVSAWYFRRHGFPAWGSLLGAALIAIQPDISVYGSMVLSDVPAAVLGLLTLILFEHAFKTSARARWWFCGGVLLAVCGLFRYALAPLGLAVAVLLLKERRFKEAAWTGGGVMLAFGPWLLFRLQAGGEEYGDQAVGFLGMGAAQLLENFRLSVAYFLTDGLPPFVGPHLLHGWSLAGAISGIAIATLTLVGALAWLFRPENGRTPLGALVVLLTVAMVVVWEVRFLYLGSSLVARLLIPVAPLILVAFAGGVKVIWARLGRPWPRVAPTLAGLVALGWVGAGVAAAVEVVNSGVLAAHLARQEAIFGSTLDYARHRLPAEARLASFKGLMVHAHTGRVCFPISNELTNRQLLSLFAAIGADYFVGLPSYATVETTLGGSPGLVDASVVILNDLAVNYPGLLTPVYFSQGGQAGIFKIDREKLLAALK